MRDSKVAHVGVCCCVALAFVSCGRGDLDKGREAGSTNSSGGSLSTNEDTPIPPEGELRSALEQLERIRDAPGLTVVLSEESGAVTNYTYASSGSFTQTPQGQTEPWLIRLDGYDYVRSVGPEGVPLPGRQPGTYEKMEALPSPPDMMVALDSAIASLQRGDTTWFTVTSDSPELVSLHVLDYGAVYEYTVLTQAPEITAPTAIDGEVSG